MVLVGIAGGAWLLSHNRSMVPEGRPLRRCCLWKEPVAEQRAFRREVGLYLLIVGLWAGPHYPPSTAQRPSPLWGCAAGPPRAPRSQLGVHSGLKCPGGEGCSLNAYLGKSSSSGSAWWADSWSFSPFPPLPSACSYGSGPPVREMLPGAQLLSTVKRGHALRTSGRLRWCLFRAFLRGVL